MTNSFLPDFLRDRHSLATMSDIQGLGDRMESSVKEKARQDKQQWSREQQYAAEHFAELARIQRDSADSTVAALERGADETGQRLDRINDSLESMGAVLSAGIAGLRSVMEVNLEVNKGILLTLRSPGATRSAELLGQGMTWLGSGRLDQARNCFTQAVDSYSTNWIAHERLGWIEIDEGRPDGALLRFRDAIGCATTSRARATVFLGIAEAQRRAERVADCLTAAREARRLQPEDAGTLYGVSRYLAFGNAIDECIPTLKKAIERRWILFAFAQSESDFADIPAVSALLKHMRAEQESFARAGLDDALDTLKAKADLLPQNDSEVGAFVGSARIDWRERDAVLARMITRDRAFRVHDDLERLFAQNNIYAFVEVVRRAQELREMVNASADVGHEALSALLPLERQRVNTLERETPGTAARTRLSGLETKRKVLMGIGILFAVAALVFVVGALANNAVGTAVCNAAILGGLALWPLLSMPKLDGPQREASAEFQSERDWKAQCATARSQIASYERRLGGSVP